METLEQYNVTMGGDVGALFAALAKAQGQMGAAKKSADNSHFKSKFADLASVLEAILPPLNANGLALVQMPGHSEGRITLTTMITHSSGGWICSKAASEIGRGSGPQAVGSAITYLRRYCAQAALALPAVDDDGEAAMGRGKSRPAPAKPKPAPAPQQRGGGFQKVKASPGHPSWSTDWKPFLAEAMKYVDAKPGQKEIDAVTDQAQKLGYVKRPSEMTPSERDALLVDLSGEVF
jgi:hypothetical protein